MPVTTVPISQLGEYICLINNDVAPLDGGWLGEMMALARRPDVGAVGAKLFYPDGRIQHGGVILGWAAALRRSIPTMASRETRSAIGAACRQFRTSIFSAPTLISRRADREAEPWMQ